MLIPGAGWITPDACGCAVGGTRHILPARGDLDGARKHLSVFEHPVKNFGRFDTASKLTCCAVALALRDAGVAHRPGNTLNIGLVGTSETGAFENNRAYFEDYIRSGRILARGNLFIYTLPTSPLAEAAIHFGLTGPMLHVSDGVNPLRCALRTAADMVAGKEVENAIVVNSAAEEALAFMICAEAPDRRTLDLCDILALTETRMLHEMIEVLNRDRKIP